MSKHDYKSGYRWGCRTIQREFREMGDKGLRICDKAAKTCLKYANDMRVKNTSKGVPLTPKLRQYYRGIADGMQDGYGKL